MRLGLIARADHRGLGQQTRAVFDHLAPIKTMVVNCPSAQPLPLHLEYFPGATVVNRLPTDRDCRDFVSDGVDMVYSAETFYNVNFPDIAREYGVRTVLHVNPEFLDAEDRPSLWAAPSLWRFDELPDPKIHLPVPIPNIVDRLATATAARFLHVVGRPAIYDRNGTTQFLAALQHVESPITATVTCQDPDYVPNLLSGTRIPDHVELVVRAGDIYDNRDLYDGQDVLVLPRRFGGLCLPAQEAVGAGLPVIMPAISPNDTWLPADWLVPAEHAGAFRAKVDVQLYTADVRELAARIDRFATDTAFFTSAADRARHIAKQMSWEQLRPVYLKTFADLHMKGAA